MYSMHILLQLGKPMATSRKGKKVDDPLQLHHGIRIGIYRGYNRIASAKIDGFAWLEDATGERMIRLLLTGVPTIPIVSRKTEQDVPIHLLMSNFMLYIEP